MTVDDGDGSSLWPKPERGDVCVCTLSGGAKSLGPNVNREPGWAPPPRGFSAESCFGDGRRANSSFTPLPTAAAPLPLPLWWPLALALAVAVAPPPPPAGPAAADAASSKENTCVLT